MKSMMLIISAILINIATPSFASDRTVTLINLFEVPADKLNESISMWEQGRNFLQTQPGYISTALHQSITVDARYPLINIAKWESAKAFMAATKKMQTEGILPRIEGVTANPALYAIILKD